MLERWLAISGREAESSATAAAYGNLGLIYGTRGELDRAEEMYRKALALCKAVGAAPQVKQVLASLDSLNESRAER
ncbi:MAG: tetratricopeptide repeat protein [Gammaproteobacteria bacterium]